MAEGLYPKPELIPLISVDSDALKLLRIGEDFIDLSRLGLIGEYTLVPATDKCPTLYYRWNYHLGIWEIYALEHDLIGFNLGVNTDQITDINQLKVDVKDLDDRVTILEGGQPDPDPEPTPPPHPEPPTPIIHSRIEQDAEKTGGNLKVIIDGGIIIFSGEIEYYEESYKFPTPGNYVGVTITASEYLWNYFRNTVKVKYKGMTFDKSVFTEDGQLTIYVFVQVPGQETPIRIYWSKEFEEDFTVAVTQESILKHS